MPKRWYLVLLWLPVLLVPAPVSAQETVGTIIVSAQLLEQKLTNVGVALGGEGSNVVNQANGALKARIDDLQQMAHDQINVPLSNLSVSVQNAANTLKSLTTRMDALLTDQQQCFFSNTATLLAGIQDVTLELQKSLTFFSSGPGPRLSYYTFDGVASSVVPNSGGHFVVTGFELWSDLPPTAQIDDSSQKKSLYTLAVQPAASQDSFASSVSADFVETNSGQCLQLEVATYEHKKFLWIIPYGSKQTADLFLPMCLPANAHNQFQIQAHADVSCVVTSEADLPSHQFSFSNASCENRQGIHPTDGNANYSWSVPQGCKIVSFQNHTDWERDASDVSLAITADNAISASGWIDTASCVWGPFGSSHLDHSTDWAHTVTPHIRCQNSPAIPLDATSGGVNIGKPSTQVCVSLKKTCSQNQQSDDSFSFTLSSLSGGAGPKSLYTSPTTSVSSSGGNSPTYNLNGYTVDGSFNPGTDAVPAQVCVVVTGNSCSVQ